MHTSNRLFSFGTNNKIILWIISNFWIWSQFPCPGHALILYRVHFFIFFMTLSKMQGATSASWYPYACWQYLSFPILDVTARDRLGTYGCLRKIGSYTPTPSWPGDICLNISYISSISQVSSTPVPQLGHILTKYLNSIFLPEIENCSLSNLSPFSWPSLLFWAGPCFSCICVVPSLNYVQNRTSLLLPSGCSHCSSDVQSRNFSSHDQSNQGYHRIFWLPV